MDLEGLLKTIKSILDECNASYALIGALGMSVHGYQRATNDVDLLIEGQKRDEIETAFTLNGFSQFHRSEEVLQLTNDQGQVDIIFARRPLSKAMLARADLPEILGIRCLRAEDIIGLKIQAVANDPRRKLRDFADIQSLAEASPGMDAGLIRTYADLFGMWDEVKGLLSMETER